MDPRRARPALESSAALLAAGVSKPVFDCRWPEARRIAERLWQAMPTLADELYGSPWLGGQDAMHEEFINAWLAWRRGVVALDPGALSHRYATGGSSEAIRECLSQFAVEGWQAASQPVLHLFHGEYEGYAAVAEGYGIRIVRHERAGWRESFSRLSARRAGDMVMLSQPSAIDGNVWEDFPVFLHFLEAHLPALRVAVDLTYVGTIARSYEIDVTSPLIDTVFFSLSKVFGVYYHRIGGVLSRRPMPGIVGTRWFKNTFSLELGRLLLAELPPHLVPRAYLAHQARAVESVGAALGVPLVASDAVLLAHHRWTEDVPAAVAPLRRGNTVRYCLTPSIDRQLREEHGESLPAGESRRA